MFELEQGNIENLKGTVFIYSTDKRANGKEAGPAVLYIETADLNGLVDSVSYEIGRFLRYSFGPFGG